MDCSRFGRKDECFEIYAHKLQQYFKTNGTGASHKKKTICNPARLMLPFRNGCKMQDFSLPQEKNAPGLIQKHLSHGTDRCYHSDIKRPPQGTQLLCRGRRGALGHRGSLRALFVARAQPFPKAWLPVLSLHLRQAFRAKSLQS